jgi:hypothetical protein
MTLAISISRYVLIATVLAALARVGPTLAQQQQPSQREDNVWGGVAHQPTEGQVQQQEKAAGIAPSQQQQNSANVDVEQLYQNLINNRPPAGTPSQ